MIIISLTYIASIEEVDAHLEAHRVWLKNALAEGWMLVAGRKNPRNGGILIARGVKEDIAAKAAADPFVINGVATIELTEFEPSMVAAGLESLIP